MSESDQRLAEAVEDRFSRQLRRESDLVGLYLSDPHWWADEADPAEHKALAMRVVHAMAAGGPGLIERLREIRDEIFNRTAARVAGIED